MTILYICCCFVLILLIFLLVYAISIYTSKADCNHEWDVIEEANFEDGCVLVLVCKQCGKIKKIKMP